MFDILGLIPGKKKHTNSGWTSFNAVCCSHRGHNPDRRMRGGLRIDGNNWVMHCFNCGYSCSFMLGRSINAKTRQFLIWCGVDSEQVQKWSLESLQKKDLLQLYLEQKKRFTIKFKSKRLPDNSEQITEQGTHKFYVDYLKKRKIDYEKYVLYCNPSGGQRKKYGIIIPYTYKGKIVGHTTRFLDNKSPKYINEQQQGYVFNIDMQKPEWNVCIVTEGIFDAMAIDGVALMHDDISNEQAILLSTLNRKIIVVPDFDKTGLKITDRALELGYHVSLPNWGPDIKDVNDAVVKYGKLPTLLAILENATMSKIKIEMRKKQIAKGL
jgi:DNA primase